MIRSFILTAALLTSTIACADGPADCELYGLALHKKQGGMTTRIVIERGASLVDNRFDDMVGTQRVSTEYMGFARITGPDGTKRQRFVCLHAGNGKKPVYFGLLLD